MTEATNSTKAAICTLLVLLGLVGCAGRDGPQSMLPDCDQASAEQQAPGKCIERPDQVK